MERRWLRIVVQRSGGTFADVDVTVDIKPASSSLHGLHYLYYFFASAACKGERCSPHSVSQVGSIM